MRPSATADIRLTNGDGQPLANVEVVFWPNTQWATFWSTIFASDFYRSLEVFHGKEFVSTEPQKRFFSAKTDRNRAGLGGPSVVGKIIAALRAKASGC
jgi:hypothetical protein